MSFLSERKKTGMSQAEVGKKIGVSDAAVSMWETGKTVPRLPILVKLSALYGCPVDALLQNNPEKAG